MAVECLLDAENELTTLVATGPVISGELGDALRQFYADNPTRLLMWNMSSAQLDEVNAGRLRTFIRQAAQMGTRRSGGRTAIVAPQDLAFGYGRMSEAFMSAEDAPFDFRVFRTEAETRAWLFAGPET